jgi:hypothetical protein
LAKERVNVFFFLTELTECIFSSVADPKESENFDWIRIRIKKFIW